MFFGSFSRANSETRLFGLSALHAFRCDPRRRLHPTSETCSVIKNRMAPAYTGLPRRLNDAGPLQQDGLVGYEDNMVAALIPFQLYLGHADDGSEGRAFFGMVLERRMACRNGWGYLDLLVQVLGSFL